MTAKYQQVGAAIRTHYPDKAEFTADELESYLESLGLTFKSLRHLRGHLTSLRRKGFPLHIVGHSRYVLDASRPVQPNRVIGDITSIGAGTFSGTRPVSQLELPPGPAPVPAPETTGGGVGDCIFEVRRVLVDGSRPEVLLTCSDGRVFIATLEEV